MPHPTPGLCTKPLPVKHSTAIQDGSIKNLFYLELCSNITPAFSSFIYLFIYLFSLRNIHSSFLCSHIAYLVEAGRVHLNTKVIQQEEFKKRKEKKRIPKQQEKRKIELLYKQYRDELL